MKDNETVCRHRLSKGLKVLAIVIVVVAVLGFIVMHLWNWLMPAIFGLHTITYWQALGLFVLGKLLFGGFRRPGGGPPRWGRHMRERWQGMSPEERERFRAGMRGGWENLSPEERERWAQRRRGCHFGRRPDAPTSA